MPSRKINLPGLLIPHWRGFGLALLAAVGITAAEVLQPLPLKIVFDYVLSDRRMPHWFLLSTSYAVAANKTAVLNFAVFAVAAIALIDAVSSYTESYLMTSIGQWVGHDIRCKVYRHIERLSLGFHDRKQIGDLISRMTKDIDAVQALITSTLMDVLIDVLTIAGMLGVMLYLNWRFSLIALAITPLLFAVVLKYKRHIKEISRSAQKKESEVVCNMQEVLSSIRVVKAFAREDFEERRFESGSRAQVETALHARAVKAKLSPIVNITVTAGTCLVIWYGARLVLSGALSSGALVVFVFYVRKLYSPLKDLAKMTNTFSRATVGLEAIQEVMREDEQIPNCGDAIEAGTLKGKIELDHVTFGYSSDHPVIQDLTLTIQPGQAVALVGPTGGGKTTIINLIPRFYDVQAGQVRIDGEDVRTYTVGSLRQNISFVLQETVLFHATIWQNIAYGKLDASKEEVIRAAKLANAHDFISELPQSYDTIVGERGLTLSGGQRQRIAIARAIVRDAPILIMDEPTTGLDANSEELVIEALHNLMKGRTCIINAHRLSTIRRADTIFVIQNGRAVEEGTHEDLVLRGGLYARLYGIQSHPVPDFAASSR